MEVRNIGEGGSSGKPVKKKKTSRGLECAAYGCCSTFYNKDGSRSDWHFFKFPQKNPDKRRWCNLIKRQDGKDGFKVNANTYLCQTHFEDDHIRRNPNTWRLNKGAAPSLLLYESFERDSYTRKLPAKRSFSDSERPTKRTSIFDESMMSPSIITSSTNTNSVLLSSPPSPNPMFESSLIDLPYPKYTDAETQTDFSYVYQPILLNPEPVIANVALDHCYSVLTLTKNELANTYHLLEHTTKKIEELSEQNQDLQEKVRKMEDDLELFKQRHFSYNIIKDDPSAVKFYTGFPNWSSLEAVYKYFEPKFQHVHYWTGPKSLEKSHQTKARSSKPGRKRGLTLMDEFFLVLVRLKVGLFVNDLADRFHISPGYVSKIFTTWINFLYHELPQLFPFPSQSMVRKYMPEQFKQYPTTRVIIDGTEIFIQVPSSMVSQSQTWSQYKHHNTWKALVGISPNGCITFVSKLWSGRVSDKHQTKECGILDLLEAGDNIMADRGYDIADILPPDVNLNIPPFKGQRNQLTAEESEETARIASVRIHVERAIGRIKNYHILNGVIPLSLSPVINQIFTVCCYLTNFLPPLCPPPPPKS